MERPLPRRDRPPGAQGRPLGREQRAASWLHAHQLAERELRLQQSGGARVVHLVVRRADGRQLCEGGQRRVGEGGQGAPRRGLPPCLVHRRVAPASLHSLAVVSGSLHRHHDQLLLLLVCASAVAEELLHTGDTAAHHRFCRSDKAPVGLGRRLHDMHLGAIGWGVHDRAVRVRFHHDQGRGPCRQVGCWRRRHGLPRALTS
eukprot:7391492-Prymnesium_polylepis.1